MSRQADIYREEIKSLREKYNQKMASLLKIKDEKLWNIAHSEALSIGQKMHELRVKANNLDRGLPPNGRDDWYGRYKIID